MRTAAASSFGTLEKVNGPVILGLWHFIEKLTDLRLQIPLHALHYLHNP